LGRAWPDNLVKAAKANGSALADGLPGAAAPAGLLLSAACGPIASTLMAGVLTAAGAAEFVTLGEPAGSASIDALTGFDRFPSSCATRFSSSSNRSMSIRSRSDSGAGASTLTVFGFGGSPLVADVSSLSSANKRAGAKLEHSKATNVTRINIFFCPEVDILFLSR
jgi:hypothetical protein